MKDKFLVVKLDQYAGNVDEIVCAALTGWGADRYGHEQARKVFDAKVRPLLTKSEDDDDEDNEYPEMPIEFMNFDTEYGSMPYALDSSSTNNLRLCVDGYTTKEMLHDMLDVWGTAYGNGEGHMEITVDGIHGGSVTVKIVGFDLVIVSESRTRLRGD
jgi:hypothetical protein